MNRHLKNGARAKVLALTCALIISSQPLAAFSLTLPTWIRSGLPFSKSVKNTTFDTLSSTENISPNIFAATFAKIKESYQKRPLATVAVAAGSVFGAITLTYHLWNKFCGEKSGNRKLETIKNNKNLQLKNLNGKNEKIENNNEKIKKTIKKIAINPLKDLETWTDYCFSKIPEGLFIDYSKDKQIEKYGIPVELKKEVTLLATTVTSMLEKQLSSGPWYEQSAKIDTSSPYVLMKNIKPGSKICAIGDIHGTIHPLLRILWQLVSLGHMDTSFKIIDPQFYLVFLGDFIDRGSFGLEVLSTILRIKQANLDSDKVIILRGNHENADDYRHPEFYPQGQYTFGLELKERFLTTKGKKNDWTEDVFAPFFKKLPVGLFVTCNDFVIQFCHGGAMASSEKGISDLKWKCTSDCYRTIEKDLEFNLTWNDFINTDKLGTDDNTGRPFCGTGKLKEIHEKQEIRAFIRGHQHYHYALKLLPAYDKEKANSSVPDWWKNIVKQEKHTDYIKNGFPLETNEYAPVFTLSTASGLCGDQGFGVLHLEKKFENCRFHLHEQKIHAIQDEDDEGQNTLTQQLKKLNQSFLYTSITYSPKMGKIETFWHEKPAEKPVLILNTRS